MVDVDKIDSYLLIMTTLSLRNSNNESITKEIEDLDSIYNLIGRKGAYSIDYNQFTLFSNHEYNIPPLFIDEIECVVIESGTLSEIVDAKFGITICPL